MHATNGACTDVVVVILTGSFEQIIALSAAPFLIYCSAAFLAVFVVRYPYSAPP